MLKIRFTMTLPAIALATLHLATAAQACSCRPFSPSEHVERSDFIFRGEVIDKRSDASLLNPLSRGERVVFEVRKSWKGPDLGKMIIHMNSTSSAACGMDFKLGWTGIVFARSGENGEPTTNLCLMLQSNSADGSPRYEDLLPGYTDAH